MTIEFKDDGDFEPLEEGPQQATVFGATLVREDGKKPNINVQFRVSDGEYTNRRIFERYYLTPKALWRLKQLLVATGKMEPNYAGSFDEEAVPGLIQGEAVTIEVGQDTWEGKTKNTVNSVSAPEEVYSNPF